MINKKVYQALKRALGAMDEAMEYTPDQFQGEPEMEFVDAMESVRQKVEMLSIGVNPFEQGYD